MLGRFVVFAFMLMAVTNAAIAEKSKAIEAISFGQIGEIPKTSIFGSDNVGGELMHRGHPDVNGVIRYTLGARTNCKNDRYFDCENAKFS